MNKKFYYALLVLVSLFAINANGTPMAYSVNSDSGNSNADSLYLINLTTGEDQPRGKLISVVEIHDHIDTEGLAFDNKGTLWGIDDATLTLFPINTASGAIPFSEIIDVSTVFPTGGKNDFGMTFSCDNLLYVTSIATNTLYRIDLDAGSKVTIGTLGVNISAIAAIGNPTKLYGLGNGTLVNGDTDSPNLYSIDVNTGVATLIGPFGSAAGKYTEGGLAFDSSGVLWAITDRASFNDLPSQILRVDVNTGTATLVSSTSEVGFESLAISPPTECNMTFGSIDGTVPPIPVLNQTGRLFAIFALMLAGILVLRRRIS